MVSCSLDYVEYCRETARSARDLHDLALRGRDNKEITRIIHEHIVEAVELGPGDDLVDIGCGDGILLRMAQQLGARSALGLLATDEEVALVRRTGVNVEQGLTDHLPVPDASASVVVCNSVLLIVPREKISASLSEMCRIANPDARIFIGEIPFVAKKDPTPQFNRRRDVLAHLYRNNGLRTWFGMLRRMVWQQIIGQPFVMRDGVAVSFFATPEEMIALAQAAGMEFVRYWQCDHLKTRNSYLFRKAE
jgi:2-polyprenyl-3-methyl-5-hydroxy-6-metoxy-1,4-benzoquinol methylase